MMTLRESIDTRHEALVLEGLDFAPSCHAPNCKAGHPEATHLVVMLACPCPPGLACAACASRGKLHLIEDREPHPARCRSCGTNAFGVMADFYRIEPL